MATPKEAKLHFQWDSDCGMIIIDVTLAIGTCKFTLAGKVYGQKTNVLNITYKLTF